MELVSLLLLNESSSYPAAEIHWIHTQGLDVLILHRQYNTHKNKNRQSECGRSGFGYRFSSLIQATTWLLQSLCLMLTVQTLGPVMCWQTDDCRHAQTPKNSSHLAPTQVPAFRYSQKTCYCRKKKACDVWSVAAQNKAKFGITSTQISKRAWGIWLLYFLERNSRALSSQKLSFLRLRQSSTPKRSVNLIMSSLMFP